MISEKKLLCTFIYAAYDSGFCAQNLDKTIKQNLMDMCKNYIKTEKYFPKEEIAKAEITKNKQKLRLRDYIYKEHFHLVKSKIEGQTGQEFSKATDLNFIKSIAQFCPINYYRVLKTNNSKLEGENIFLKNKKTLKILPGLETPNIGDIISGHWNHMLEIVTGWNELEKYQKTAEQYFKNFK